MTSRCFVINEWLLHDLLGENGPDKRTQSYGLLRKIYKKCDHIAVLQESPWIEKAYKLMEQSDLLSREISKFLRLNFLVNSKKCSLLNAAEIKPLAQELRKKIPEEKDVYLVETYISVEAELLVTTDVKLQKALLDSGINIELREKFIGEYR